MPKNTEVIRIKRRTYHILKRLKGHEGCISFDDVIRKLLELVEIYK